MSFDDHRPVAARLTVLSGPSGVGKGSVKALIRERYPWVWFSVSATTRSPRPDEIPGFHYHYYDRAHFEKLAADGMFLEWAQYANNLYGTPRGPIEERLAAGLPAVTEADLQGARQIRQAMPQARLVFLAPPSWDELVRRLTGRGTEDAETIKRRLSLAEEELSAESEFDHTIVNYSVEQATEELVGLLGSPVQPSEACPAGKT